MPNEDENNFHETAPRSPTITLSTRTYSQNQKDDTLSNLRANNSFDYHISSNRSTPALESRNEFVISNRTRSDLRNDISNEYVRLNRNSSSVPDSRENTINIMKYFTLSF